MQEKPFFAPIIRRWPTVVLFASEVGCPEKNAREWLRIDSIPATWFAAVVRASAKRGFAEVTPALLADMAERRRHGQEKAKASPVPSGASAAA